jgi:hypothetical protein
LELKPRDGSAKINESLAYLQAYLDRQLIGPITQETVEDTLIIRIEDTMGQYTAITRGLEKYGLVPRI